jgi:hypothetical protein
MRLIPALMLTVAFAGLSPLVTTPVFAQQGEGHEGRDGHNGQAHSQDHEMPHILSQPNGSGTAWLPTGTNVHTNAVHFQAGDWTIMTHGEAVLRYNTVNMNNTKKWKGDGSPTAGNSHYPELERGGRIIDMPNWAMVSAQRTLPTGGTLLLRSMLSLEPMTIGKQGYPLLYQTGEGLVDRQHPHDLFMELGVLYAHPVAAHQTAFAYAGLPGEPALGPAAFMHRPSIGGNPDAPLGHHHQDATHITHGVLTAGYILHQTKFDASWFNGREPDSKRWNIDVGALDSWSVRLTQNISQWSVQASYASIHDPEPVFDTSAADHGDVHRTTVSISRRRVVRPEAPLIHAKTRVWGMNAGHHGSVTHSVLSESSLSGRRGQVWGRWEVLQREGTELDLVGIDADRQYWVYALSLGAGGAVYRVAGTEVYLGMQGTFNMHDEGLKPYYGRFPLSGQVFIKIRPAGLFATP